MNPLSVLSNVEIAEVPTPMSHDKSVSTEQVSTFTVQDSNQRLGVPEPVVHGMLIVHGPTNFGRLQITRRSALRKLSPACPGRRGRWCDIAVRVGEGAPISHSGQAATRLIIWVHACPVDPTASSPALVAAAVRAGSSGGRGARTRRAHRAVRPLNTGGCATGGASQPSH